MLVIGSGFGGSVSALRLTEKGYRVGVLEAGRRFEDGDYPRTSWNLRTFLWAPKLGCQGSVGEIVDIPMTAHFLGGCAIGDSPETGVVDPYQRVYGHPGLHVVDGSAISANLGVNPALTITAQAERAMALWPNKDETDPRPRVGAAYKRVAPVTPRNPIVPASASAALKLPVVEIR